jgi:hypothetical protein
MLTGADTAQGGPVLSSRALLAVLMTVATALFVLGVSIERGQADHHAREPTGQVREGGEEHSDEGDETHAAPAATPDAHDSNQEEPKLLGVDPESLPLVVLATLGSLLLAAAVLRWPPARALLALVVVAMLAFAALDIREVAHQLDERRGGVAAIAALVAVLHLAAATLAAVRSRKVAICSRFAMPEEGFGPGPVARSD